MCWGTCARPGGVGVCRCWGHSPLRTRSALCSEGCKQGPEPTLVGHLAEWTPPGQKERTTRISDTSEGGTDPVPRPWAKPTRGLRAKACKLHPGATAETSDQGICGCGVGYTSFGRQLLACHWAFMETSFCLEDSRSSCDRKYQRCPE